MSEPIFVDKSKIPTQNEINDILGKTGIFWDDIKKFIKNEIGEINEEWKFYMKKTGWQMKTMLKKRNLFFFTPYKEFFRITFVFGDKAVAVIKESNLPEDIITTLINAKKYMEGRGLTIEVKNQTDTENVKKLIKIKVNN